MKIIFYRRLFLWIALGIVTIALGTVLALGLKPSIDFTGGSLLEVRYTTMPDKMVVEEAAQALDFGGVDVRRSDTEAGSGYLIKVRTLNEAERSSMTTALTALGEGGEITRFTSIGPTIGAELKDKAVFAIGAVLVITIVYVAFAFAGVGVPVSSWVYGFLVTIILAHDILIPIFAMSLLSYFTGAEADILFVTALLTILGYSVNDTIVIFDRVREKLKENRNETVQMIDQIGAPPRREVTYTLTKPFSDIVGQAVDETMGRSINTSLTVLIALVALYVFGSTVTANLSLILIVGLIAGAYSSIFIASPLLVVYETWRRESKTKVAK